MSDPWAEQPIATHVTSRYGPIEMVAKAEYDRVCAERDAAIYELMGASAECDELSAERDAWEADAEALASYLRNVPGCRPGRDGLIAAHDRLIGGQTEAAT